MSHKSLIKLRRCTCCHEDLPTSSFTHNPKRGTYTPTYRECNVWLTLFRQAFGPTRNMRYVRQYSHDYYQRMKRSTTAANDLYAAWGIRSVA
jgi:hypothetical protein